MTRCGIATLVEEARAGRGEDRIAIRETVHCTRIVVVDGAGGVVGGAHAAEAICRAFATDTGDLQQWLAQQDTLLAEKMTGMAAAVALDVAADGEIAGASVGDCEAWLFGRGESEHLTAAQRRKPLLGDGGAVPIVFRANVARADTLLVATDGLWKYAKHARIRELARIRPLEAALKALVDEVRLPNGELQDDIALVAVALHSGSRDE